MYMYLDIGVLYLSSSDSAKRSTLLPLVSLALFAVQRA